MIRRLRAPAEQRDIVDDGGGGVPCLYEVVKTRRTVAFRKFACLARLLVASHDGGEMHKHGRLPAERLVEQDVFRRRGDELGAADDVRDLHETVVDDIGKVIGRHTVAL